jgi:peptidoglycan/xylan/chitin deacetylase (PgdA/CDA1 family)
VTAVLAQAARHAVDVVGRPVDAVAAATQAGSAVVLLIYHRVGGRTRSPVDLPRAVFAGQLDRLADSVCVVDLDTAARLLRGDQQPRPGVAYVALTFDDGTADWVDVVLPELVERRMPATFYVATDFVERGRPFPDDGAPVSWRALDEMASTGLATIGSHTHTHQVLARSTGAEADAEIERSVALIEERLGAPCHHFAYPKAVLPSPAAEVVVRRRFATAALAGNRPNRLERCDLHRLGRHALTIADDAAAFDRKVRGGARLEGALRAMRGRRAPSARVTGQLR